MSITQCRNRLLERIIPPAAEPVTLSAAKLYLRVDHNDEDDLINDCITASRMMAENWLRRSLLQQQWKLAYDEYAPFHVGLPMGPVQNVVSVVIVNQDNTEQTADESSYYLNGAKNALIFLQQISGFRVEISYQTGYGNTAADVPAPIRQGILGQIADMYENRADSISAIPPQVLALYMPFREVLL